MKRILIVDDDQDMLWILQKNLSRGLDDVDVITVQSAEEALTTLSETEVNLVISDIVMPGMSGLDLLLEINNNYPNTNVIVMTAYPSKSYEHQAMINGSLRYIEKPFDIKEMTQVVEDFLNQSNRFQGTVDGIDLVDIVQLNGLSGASAALKVITTEQEGIIFFKHGHVVHAICGELTGETAFFTILGFQKGTLQTQRGTEPPTITIEKNLQTLLLEAAVSHDEEDELTAIADSEPIANREDNPALHSGPHQTSTTSAFDDEDYFAEHLTLSEQPRSNNFIPLREMERSYILEVLVHTKGNKSEAARILQISRSTLRNKIA